MEKLIFRPTPTLHYSLAQTLFCVSGALRIRFPNENNSNSVFPRSRTRAGQHSLERYVQAKPIDPDHAQRTWISESN